MKFNWETFGHEQVKTILEKQLTTGRFPHAYLFVGPTGIGKKRLAVEFAQKVLETKNLASHPDFRVVDTGAEITVEQILDLITYLKFKPFVGKKKVAILNDAQNLNLQSSNALLKTLEEPSPSTIIILIASTGRLLPTIISRCQVFTMDSFSKPLLLKFAHLQKLNATSKMVELSFGSPGELVNLAENKQATEQREKDLQKFHQIKSGSFAERLLAVTDFGRLGSLELEGLIFTWCRSAVAELTENPSAFKTVQALLDAYVGLKSNKNKKFVLQELFFKI